VRRGNWKTCKYRRSRKRHKELWITQDKWWVMVSLEKHIQLSLKRTGKEYRELHEWLDGKNISYKERLSRHNINNISKLLPVVEKRFGKDGVREYIQHIKDDCNNNILVRILIISKLLKLKIKL
jgi:hypothetical protein